MVLRVAVPGKPIKLIDLGPHGNGTRRPWDSMRRPIDEAIATTWHLGHPIRLSRPR